MVIMLERTVLVRESLDLLSSSRSEDGMLVVLTQLIVLRAGFWLRNRGDWLR